MLKRIRKFFCDVMDWHEPNLLNLEGDVVNLHTTCWGCGRKILQDSEGNWFGSDLQ